jgi:hypothetical protein
VNVRRHVAAVDGRPAITHDIPDSSLSEPPLLARLGEYFQQLLLGLRPTTAW